MKLSIVVLKGNDEAIPHDEVEDEDEKVSDSNLQDMVLQIPGINVTYNEVSVKIFKCEKLPKMDTVGWCDPYIRMSFGGVKQETKKFKGENPIFKEEIVLPIAGNQQKKFF